MSVSVSEKNTQTYTHAQTSLQHLPDAQEKEKALCGLTAGEDRAPGKDDDEEERHVERPVANEEGVPKERRRRARGCVTQLYVCYVLVHLCERRG